MEQLRKLLNELETLEKISNEAENAYEQDYMNEELELAFDIAYQNQMRKNKEVATYITVFTNLKIDIATATRMINNPVSRIKLVNLLV